METGERSMAYPDPELGDGVVRLRPWEHRDIDCVRLATTDERIPRATTVPAAFTVEEGIAYIERQWGRQSNGEGLSLVIEAVETGDAVGSIVALFRSQPSVVGIGYWIVPAARGRGSAARSVTLISTWLLGHTSTTRVEVLVRPDNVPSRRTLERCGFQEEGRLRSYLEGTDDVIVYSLLASDREPSVSDASARSRLSRSDPDR